MNPNMPRFSSLLARHIGVVVGRGFASYLGLDCGYSALLEERLGLESLKSILPQKLESEKNLTRLETDFRRDSLGQFRRQARLFRVGISVRGQPQLAGDFTQV